MSGRVSEADARAALFAVWRNFGDRAFLVPDGRAAARQRAALLAAERRGWLWFPAAGRAAVTAAGVAALAPYGVQGEKRA